MTFNKRFDITLTQMAQYIDASNTEDYNQDIIVEYLYHLFLFNAQKNHLFNDEETYDDFALFCVSKLLLRVQSNNAPIKSVVNYINKVLNPWYAEYVRNFCCGSPDIPVHDFDVSDFGDYLIDSSSEQDYNNYDFYCLNITSALKQHLRKIPRKKNSAEWSNIYTSCLLTLQDRIEFATQLCINSNEKEDSLLLSRVVRELKTKDPILFHLEEHMSCYISVLVNELIHALAAELTHSIHTHVTASDCLKNLVMVANSKEEE